MSEEDNKAVKVHKCKGSEDAPWTVENRGEGWYLYSGEQHGAEQVKFCPGCGEPLN